MLIPVLPLPSRLTSLCPSHPEGNEGARATEPTPQRSEEWGEEIILPLLEWLRYATHTLPCSYSLTLVRCRSHHSSTVFHYAHQFAVPHWSSFPLALLVRVSPAYGYSTTTHSGAPYRVPSLVLSHRSLSTASFIAPCLGGVALHLSNTLLHSSSC